MFPYITMLIIAVMACLISPVPIRRWGVSLTSAAVLLALFIGFRHEVGGDWGAYVRHFNNMSEASLFTALSASDPGYKTLNWLVALFGGDVHVVNLICGAIFTIALLQFCRAQNEPWLALVVAIAYLVIVVAMGYTRQSVAIGLFMFAIVNLERGRVLTFLAWVALATLFHKSALLAAPFVLLVQGQRRWIYVLASGLAIAGLYQQFLADSVGDFYQNYWQAEYSSQGALIRILLNALPAVIFLVWRSRFNLIGLQEKFWTIMCVLCVGTLLALTVASSSTAIDRVALYMIPVQLFVWSRLPQAFAPGDSRSQAQWRAGIIVLYASVMLVWLVFAANAGYWLPYKFYPFQWASGSM